VITEFISFFVLSVLLTLDLDGVICKMNHRIHIIEVELVRAGSNVAQRKPIKPALPANEQAKHECPDVKFATFIQ
jgi:hypothetical protein